ncbi:MAG: TetR family transcriptional regulator [Alphaproteobacteria bacterium]|nr:TetR family transcriptional regulator [Alphaproteobacteria bacterium]
MLTPRPDWLEPLNDPRNEAILTAAFDVFVAKGFHGATMADVARDARVSKETLYARFDSKEGLLFALCAWGCGKTGDKGAAIMALLPHEPIAALRLYAEMVLAQLTHCEAMALYRVVVAESERAPQLGITFDEMGQIGSREVRAALFDALRAKGLIEADDLAAFEDDFFGLVRGNLMHEVLIGARAELDPAEVPARAERAAARLLKAYAPSMPRAANAA